MAMEVVDDLIKDGGMRKLGAHPRAFVPPCGPAAPRGPDVGVRVGARGLGGLSGLLDGDRE